MSKRAREEDNPALIMIREKRGLATELGKLLNLSRTAVWMWKRVPPEHAVTVARHLKMPVHIVCPTVFPPPKKREGSKKHNQELNSSR